MNTASTIVTEVYPVPLTVGGQQGQFAHSPPHSPLKGAPKQS